MHGVIIGEGSLYGDMACKPGRCVVLYVLEMCL